MLVQFIKRLWYYFLSLFMENPLKLVPIGIGVNEDVSSLLIPKENLMQLKQEIINKEENPVKKDCICSLCIESKLETPLECAWRDCTRPRKHRSSFCGTNHIPDFS